MKLTLPWPPTTNNLHTVANGRKILSEAGRQYKAEAFYALRNQDVRYIPEGDLEVTYWIYMPRLTDWDNRVKAVQDALKGVAWKDDSQIAVAHVYRLRDRDNPRVEVEIQEVEG